MGKKVKNVAFGNDRVPLQAGSVTTGKPPKAAKKPPNAVKVTNVRKGNAQVGHQTDGTVYL